MKNMMMQQEKQFWNIEIDNVKNYKFYFPFDNAENLRDKMSKKKNQQKKGFFLSRQIK